MIIGFVDFPKVWICENVENFLVITKFFRACILLETTQAGQECDLSCVDRFNLQRYFTSHLSMARTQYLLCLGIIAHSGRKMIIREFSRG